MDNLDFRPGARFMLLLGQDIGTFFFNLCLHNSDMS